MDTQISSSMEQGSYLGVSRKNKHWGLVFLIGPYVLIIVTMLIWTISSFVARSLAYSDGGSSLIAIMRVMNVALGFLGIFGLLGMLIGIPLACLFFSRKEPMQGLFDPRSGKGDASIIPEEVKGWSWGGFVLGMLWGLYHQVWLSLLLLVPFVNLVIWIYMGIKGKELAWRKNVWPSLEAFKVSQKKWDTAGVVILVIQLILVLLPFVLMAR